MARQKKIKFMSIPLFTRVGAFNIQVPENFPKDERITSVSATEMVVSKAEYASMLHLKASRIHEHATAILGSVPVPVESNNETAMAAPTKRKYTRRSKDKLVATIRKINSRTRAVVARVSPRLGEIAKRIGSNTAKLAELAAKARARRAAKKLAAGK